MACEDGRRLLPVKKHSFMMNYYDGSNNPHVIINDKVTLF